MAESTIPEKMHFMEPAMHAYYQRQKFRPLAQVSGNIRCMRIFTGFLGEGVKRQWCCWWRKVSAFSAIISSETLEIDKVSVIIGGMQCLIGFSVISKCMTLNDLE